jgi:hypothetical protein
MIYFYLEYISIVRMNMIKDSCFIILRMVRMCKNDGMNYFINLNTYIINYNK